MTAPHDEIRSPFCTYTLNSNELFEALRCDTINNQRLNRYTFKHSPEHGLSVTVGNELKGRTETTLAEGLKGVESFEVTVEGGLENVLKFYPANTILLEFLDFRPEQQGIRLILRLPNGDFVLQAGLLL